MPNISKKERRARYLYQMRLRHALERDEWTTKRITIDNPKLLKCLTAIAFMEATRIEKVVDDLLVKQLSKDKKWSTFFNSGYDLKLSTVINIGKVADEPHENVRKKNGDNDTL